VRGVVVSVCGRRGAAGVALALAVCAPRPAVADVAGALEKAATFDPTTHFGDVGAITWHPVFQTRWTYVESPQADPRAVAGFSVPRARMTVIGTLLENLSFEVRFGTRSNGNATTEVGFAQVRWSDLRFRAGQFPLKLDLGEEPTPDGQTPNDLSTYANTFAGGETQGAQLLYDGPVRLVGTVGNGARSGFSELLSPIVADVAGTGRIDVPIGTARSPDIPVQVSFRQGQKVTARLGAIGHIQTKKATLSNPSAQAALAGGDFVVRGSGFSLLGSLSYLQLVPGGAPSVEDAGVMLLASLMAARRVELFAQFDAVWPLGARAPHPPGFAGGQPGTTQFRTVTLGTNYFVVPDSTRAKVQIDLQAMPDGQSTSIAQPITALGILASPGPQIAMRLQLTMAL
jgi:hypothetical protein